jgi:cytochrome b
MAIKSKSGVTSRSQGMLLPMRVWDLSTRLFHWTLLLALVFAYASISLAEGPYAGLMMRVHVICGETVLGLLLFRILWGLFGSDTARFSHFLHNPLAALRHLAQFRRREPDLQVGHNAAGGWMVLLMLLLIAAQVGTGLFANDDGNTTGPLAQLVSKPLSDQLSKLHGINFNILAAAAALHVLAVLLYAVIKGQNLVRPMLTGKKRLPAATHAPRMANPWLAGLTMAVAAGVTVLIARL